MPETQVRIRPGRLGDQLLHHERLQQIPHAIPPAKPVGTRQVGENRRESAVEQVRLGRFDKPFGGAAVPGGQSSNQEEPFKHGEVVGDGIPV